MACFCETLARICTRLAVGHRMSAAFECGRFTDLNANSGHVVHKGRSTA